MPVPASGPSGRKRGSGLSDSVNHVFWTRRAIPPGDPPAAFEAERIDWIPLDQVPGLIASGRIRSAVTAAALMLLRDRRTGDT
jgi:hypothetical protein